MAAAVTGPPYTEQRYPKPSPIRPRFCEECKKYTNKISLCTTPKNGGRYMYSCPECKNMENNKLLINKKTLEQKKAPFLWFVDHPGPTVYNNPSLTKEQDHFNKYPNYPRLWADGVISADPVEIAIWKYECNKALDEGLPPPPKPTMVTPLPVVAGTPTPPPPPSSQNDSSVRDNLLLPAPAPPKNAIDQQQQENLLSTLLSSIDQVKETLKELVVKFDQLNDTEAISRAVVEAVNNNHGPSVQQHPPLFDLGVPQTSILKPVGKPSRKRQATEAALDSGHPMDKKQNASSNDTAQAGPIIPRPVEHLRPQKPLGVGLSETDFNEVWLKPAEDEIYA